jgi:hypothetical protein
MTIVHRYTAGSEYAALLSTAAPSVPHNHQQSRWRPTFSNLNLCPSSAEIQMVVRRMRGDPDLSQSSIFRFCAPLLVFVTCIAAGILALKMHRVHLLMVRVFGDDMGQLARGLTSVGLLLVLGIPAALAVLRLVIWGVASAVGMFVEKDLTVDPTKGSRDEFQLSEVNVLMGGFL